MNDFESHWKELVERCPEILTWPEKGRNSVKALCGSFYKLGRVDVLEERDKPRDRD